MKKLGAVFVFIILGNSLWAYPVVIHQKALLKALEVCQRDDKATLTAIFVPFQEDLLRGVSDADLKPFNLLPPTLSPTHGHHPFKHVGFVHEQQCGGDMAQCFLQKAIETFQSDPSKSVYYLGVAAHFVEDAFIPHHSNPSILTIGGHDFDGYIVDGHKTYEDYQLKVFEDINIDETSINFFPKVVDDKNNIHCQASDAFGWVDFGAHSSYDYYKLVNNPKDQSHYQEVSEILLSKMIRTLAGFLSFAGNRLVDTTPDQLRPANTISQQTSSALTDLIYNAPDIKTARVQMKDNYVHGSLSVGSFSKIEFTDIFTMQDNTIALFVSLYLDGKHTVNWQVIRPNGAIQPMEQGSNMCSITGDPNNVAYVISTLDWNDACYPYNSTIVGNWQIKVYVDGKFVLKHDFSNN